MKSGSPDACATDVSKNRSSSIADTGIRLAPIWYLAIRTTQRFNEEVGRTPRVDFVDVNLIRISTRLRPATDVTALAESISNLGLLQPILLNEQHQLIAGFNRLEACKALGHTQISAIVLTVDEITSKLAEIDENLIRKELSVLERAEHYLYRKQLYDGLYPDTRWGGRRGNQHSGGIRRESGKATFCRDAATKTRQSTRSIQRMITIARNLPQGVRDVLRNTPVADSNMELLRLTKVPHHLQCEVASALAGKRARTVIEAWNAAERQFRLKQPCSFPLEGEDYRLLLGDFRQRADEIASSSVRLILTDPPYFRDSLEIFSGLSAFAARVLQPGGSFLAMVGQYFLPEILNRLGEHLRFHWLITCVMPGQNRYIQSRRVRAASKHFLWFQKGMYTGQTVRDVIKSGGPDKHFHPWGQPEGDFAHFIECFTRPGDLVLDPTMGGGVTAAAATRLGRRFVGFDVDKDAVETTRRRLQNDFA